MSLEMQQPKTSPLQNAIMISSIIGSILSDYDNTLAKERKKPILVLRARVKKFMFTRSRSNRKEFLEAINCADIAWRTSMSHFAKYKLQIDAVSTVVKLHNLYEGPMSKYANIHEKQIEAFSRDIENEITLKIEMDSYEVADFLLDELSKFSGVKRIELQRIKLQGSIFE
jgi:hypothetical protein